MYLKRPKVSYRMAKSIPTILLQADLLHFMGLLFKCEIPVQNVYALAARDFPEYYTELENMTNLVDGGDSISNAFTRHAGAFHARIPNYFVLGEEKGNLDEELLEASAWLRQEVGLPCRSNLVPDGETVFYNCLAREMPRYGSLSRALGTIRKEYQHICNAFPTLPVLDDVLIRIFNGRMSCSQALATQYECFSPYVILILHRVEGRTDGVEFLNDLAHYITEKKFLRHHIEKRIPND